MIITKKHLHLQKSDNGIYIMTPVTKLKYKIYYRNKLDEKSQYN